MRLFFAIDLPEGLTQPFAALQDDLCGADGLRFTDPTQAHLTMKFLGDVPEEEAGNGERGDGGPTVADAKAAGAAAVDAADLPPFEVEVGGLGAFPSEEYISVVWAGVRDGAADLEALAATLETEATDRGFDAAEKEFTPHVTLARMDDARGKDLVQDYLRNTDPTVGRFRVDELRLERSVLTDEGADYRTVARFPL
ncbi:RNA 2',3'-cyclic phosphodiesterase [Halolamina litorea]|uniref:RNA 2',3'-cyclic phosphodiesterase n=1 Tax=Halolamina litorea TaxID=1515593 RepID=A0ABD6BMU4_9EURY|nr:RNA 2',3'-cyclic phosphodiesterase [Halolamina litorea]